MAEIYGLYSARDGTVRYVGQTTGSRIDRFEQHQRAQIGRFITPVYTWMHREWKAGYPVQCALLETCSNEKRIRDDRESEWIRKFPNLLNMQKVKFRGCTPSIIREIRDYMQRHIFNHEGHVGVHYSIASDQFRVLVYTGSDSTWLAGDESLITGGEDIWFSDLARALNAREAYRRGCRFITWPPDRVE